jgi:hypothetical protein
MKVKMNKEYPTEKDIEKHIKQFIGVLRQYFRGFSKIEFVKNGLQSLYTDILLEAHSEKHANFPKEDVEINFNSFIKKLSK